MLSNTWNSFSNSPHLPQLLLSSFTAITNVMHTCTRTLQLIQAWLQFNSGFNWLLAHLAILPFAGMHVLIIVTEVPAGFTFVQFSQFCMWFESRWPDNCVRGQCRLPVCWRQKKKDFFFLIFFFEKWKHVLYLAWKTRKVPFITKQRCKNFGLQGIHLLVGFITKSHHWCNFHDSPVVFSACGFTDWLRSSCSVCICSSDDSFSLFLEAALLNLIRFTVPICAGSFCFVGSTRAALGTVCQN